MKPLRTCERLEPRLALAGLYTFVDIDGDIVTAKSSKGSNAELQAALTLSAGTSGQLQKVNLAANPVFAGTNFSVAAKKAGAGNGLVAVGEILAANVDVGTISVKGDLGRILAGDGDKATPGVKSLSVDSIGRYGTSTGAANLDTLVVGGVPKLAVKTDVVGATVTIPDGRVGTLSIGGSVFGAASTKSGRIDAMGGFGTVVVKGNIVGGSGSDSGAIVASAGGIGKLSIGGSVRGGDGQQSGVAAAALNVKSIVVKAGLEGGLGDGSGSVLCSGKINSLTVGGSVVGGAGKQSGAVEADGGVNAATIKGDVRGGAGQTSGMVVGGPATGKVVVRGSVLGADGNGSGFVGGWATAVVVKGAVTGGNGTQSGSIFGAGISSVSVGKNLTGGSGLASGVIAAALGRVALAKSLVGGTGVNSGMVYAIQGSITKMTVGGSVLGGSGLGSGKIGAAERIVSLAVAGDIVGTAAAPLQIFAAGAADGLAIGTVTVGGSIRETVLLAGYTSELAIGVCAPVNGKATSATIGSVRIRGDLDRTSIAAGVKPPFFPAFGTQLDSPISVAGASRIDSVVIRGAVLGDADPSRIFGISSRSIGVVKVQKKAVAIPAAGGFTPLGSSPNTVVRVVP